MFRRFCVWARPGAMQHRASLYASYRMSSTSAGAGEMSELHKTLSQMIRKDRVVVFLTGTPASPQCRFTRGMVDLLNAHSIPYIYFDVLEDDEVCEELKVFSNWPTYPQLYIDGELIGGYDISKEMARDGRLAALLREKGIST